MASSNPQALSDEIDDLLTRYLQLLDEYTSLRVPLGSLQSSIYTNIARANFQAERGVSYGREYYDRRSLRAGRLCRVTGDTEDGTAFLSIEKENASTGKAGSDIPVEKAENKKSKDSKTPSPTQDIEEGMEKISVQAEGISDPTPSAQGIKQDQDQDKEEVNTTKPTPTSTTIPDPIRMFGFSIPSALRTAQSSSIQLVETSIPRLATISLQMRALEIQIRRAKKYRAKALVAEGGKGDVKVVGTGVVV